MGAAVATAVAAPRTTAGGAPCDGGRNGSGGAVKVVALTEVQKLEAQVQSVKDMMAAGDFSMVGELGNLESLLERAKKKEEREKQEKGALVGVRSGRGEGGER